MRRGGVNFPLARPAMRWGRRMTGLESVEDRVGIPALFGGGTPGTASLLDGTAGMPSLLDAERAQRLARLEEVTFAERDVYGRTRRMGLEMVVTTRWAVPMGSVAGAAVPVEFGTKGGGR